MVETTHHLQVEVHALVTTRRLKGKQMDGMYTLAKLTRHGGSNDGNETPTPKECRCLVCEQFGDGILIRHPHGAGWQSETNMACLFTNSVRNE